MQHLARRLGFQTRPDPLDPQQRGWATFERERQASRVEHSRDRAQWQKLLDPDS
jgi:hypothetical protein